MGESIQSLLFLHPVQSHRLEVLSQSSVVSRFEVENPALLTVLSALSPAGVLGSVSYLVIAVVVSINNHEDILEVFSQNWGALWAIHDSV